jgi:hypothetical protein
LGGSTSIRAMSPSIRHAIAVPLVGFALAASACGGGGSSGGDSQNVCQAANAFVASAQKLNQMSVATDGKDAVVAAIQDVQTQAQALASVAKDQLGDQARAVAAAYQTMASNVSTAANPAAVQQDLEQGKANVQAQQAALEQDIASSCSSS